MRRHRREVAAILLGATSLVVSALPVGSTASGEVTVDAGTPGTIRGALAQSSALPNPRRHPIVSEVIRTFYENRDHEPAWIHGHEVTPAGRSLVARVASGQRDGLPPLRWLPPLVDSLVNEGTLERVDVMLTEIFLTYGLLLAWGQVAPETVHSGWPGGGPPTLDLLGALTSATLGGDVNAALDGLAPSSPSYRGLRDALTRYLAVEAAGGWDSVPGGSVLKPGDADARVRTLRERLQAGGDLTTSSGGDRAPLDVYDGDLTTAVRRFQARHGLPADGIVGPVTVAALNVPVATRLRQIAVNMERHRWLPALPPRRVSVNIPGRQLTVFDGGQELMRMRVLTGRSYKATALLADHITHVGVAPRGRGPDAFAAADFPAQHTRPNPELETQRGWLSFDFAASGAYLHGAPGSSLDDAGTEGYLLIERPLALAAFGLAGDLRWHRQEIEAALASGQSLRIRLPREIPVYLLYWTAWAESDGTVNFREDPYGFDDQLTLALMGLPVPATPSKTVAADGVAGR